MSDRHEFFNRRLHSLLGVIPIGIFVIQHLVVNHFAVYGEESFNNAAGFMESLPFRLTLETVVIYLPILFHAILGIYIALWVPRNNVGHYSFMRNWLFMLQRISGVITLIFIAWHVWQTRIQVALGTTNVDYQLMEDILSSTGMFWFYIIGVISTTFHFANGLWGFSVTWGITQSKKSQKILTYVTLLVFLVLSYIGVRTLIQFAYGV